MIGAVGSSTDQRIQLDELTKKVTEGQQQETELQKKQVVANAQVKVAQAQTSTVEDAMSQLLG